MGASSARLGGFPEATHGRRRCGIPAGRPTSAAAHGQLGSALAFDGQWTEAYKEVWTGRCDWDCDSVLAAPLWTPPARSYGVARLREGSRKNGIGGFTRAHFPKK